MAPFLKKRIPSGWFGEEWW